MVLLSLCLNSMIKIWFNIWQAYSVFWFAAFFVLFFAFFSFSYNIKLQRYILTFFSFCLCDLIIQFELCAVISSVMFDAFLINFWAHVAHMHTHTHTHTCVHTELHADNHFLIGKINLLISSQLGVSIKYLVNKLPLPKLAIMYEPEGKWPICYGCLCLCVCVCL